MNALCQRGLDDDAFVSAGQVSLKKTFSEQYVGNLSIGYHSYSDADLSDQLGNTSGNALVNTDTDGTPDAYASDFGILNPIASLSYNGWKKPITLSGEYLHNVRANISDDTGWALGIALGKTKVKGDWKAYYQWQQVEQVAVFSLVSQDDFLSTTNFSGHVAGTKYQITDTMQLHLWAMMSERNNPDTAVGQTRQSQWRLRADLNVKF